MMTFPTEHEIRQAIADERARLKAFEKNGDSRGAHSSRNALQPLFNQLEIVQEQARDTTLIVEDNDLYQTVVDR